MKYLEAQKLDGKKPQESVQPRGRAEHKMQTLLDPKGDPRNLVSSPRQSTSEPRPTTKDEPKSGDNQIKDKDKSTLDES